jgi:cellulose synthase/poly-beta-1,6-N-acetylglucosamine synthase-like glycosyltransferase
MKKMNFIYVSLVELNSDSNVNYLFSYMNHNYSLNLDLSKSKEREIHRLIQAVTQNMTITSLNFPKIKANSNSLVISTMYKLNSLREKYSIVIPSANEHPVTLNNLSNLVNNNGLEAWLNPD